MKTFLAFLVALLFVTPAMAQVAAYTENGIVAPNIGEAQTVSHRLGTTLSVEWDFAPADIKDGNVSRFEARVNTGTWVNTGVTIPAPATATSYTYRIPSALLPVGTHVVAVRACNVTECGPADTAPLTITSMMPKAPGGLRIVPGDSPVTVAQAVEMANAYSILFQLRRLSDTEVWLLSSQYGYPMTKGHVIQFMDEKATGLGQ